jgi:hypothetical protein
LSTPKAQTGTWTLTAPDGRQWVGASPLKAAAVELRERVPINVAIERINDALEMTDEERLDAMVDDFAFAMKEKLHRKAEQGRSGWDNPANAAVIRAAMLEHAARGPGQEVDVANLAAMLWNLTFNAQAEGRAACGESRSSAELDAEDSKMSRDELKRWECENCGTITFKKDLLRAANPFDREEDDVAGCPSCRVVFGENIHEICDEPGCDEHAHCGWPTGNNGDEFGGYRRTCGAHMTKRSNAPAKPPAFGGSGLGAELGGTTKDNQ